MPSSAFNRRQFLQTGTAAAVGLSLGLPRSGMAAPVWGVLDPDPARRAKLQTPAVHDVLMRALDAARGAGARYADARITYSRERSFRTVAPLDTVRIGLSVRALVDGVWGFATSPHVLAEEGPRLGREAVAMAKSITVRETPRVVEWAPIPVIKDSYVAPVQIDPFDVPLEEVLDWGQGLERYIRYYRAGTKADAFGNRRDILVNFQSQERLFASTEGSLISQAFMNVIPLARLSYQNITLPLHSAQPISLTAPRTFGWEVVANAHYHTSVPAVIAECEAAAAQSLPVKPFDIGRFDLMVSAHVAATLLEKTLAPATQLDRALGYEANATGTSYLGPDPMAFLGTPVAAPPVTLTANHSRPGAAATVQWDDDGIAPADFPLITKGTLVDYQTTREQAPWLKAWYAKQGMPVHSHGCSWSSSADRIQIQHTPNLVLEPDTADHSLAALREGMATGIEIVALHPPVFPFFDISIDQQCLNGLASVEESYEIRRGKRVAQLTGPLGVSFRSPELWKSVLAVGGAAMQERYTVTSQKDEPGQSALYSIDAVPLVIKQQAVIDYTRKA